MKKIRLIINSLIVFLIFWGIARFLDGFINMTARSSYDKSGAMSTASSEFIVSMAGYEYYMKKYPENGKEILDFYYHNPKENELLKDHEYQGYKVSMDRCQDAGRRAFKKPIRIIRLKEKPKSRFADINVEVPFVAYYIDKKPKLYDHDLFTYCCWEKDKKSNKCILVTFPNTFKD